MYTNRLLSIQNDLGKSKKTGSGLTSMFSTNFPSPTTIMSNYPPRSTGGVANDYCSQAGNECAIRMSIAVQKSGISASELQKSSKFRKTHKHSGSNVVHQPSAAAFADWLYKAIKPPKKMIHPTGKWQASDFSGKSGILYFAHSHRGGNGPGHIDVLLNGSTGSGFYPNKVIWFYEYKNGSW